jgi:ATP-binding cassette, subfamily B, bacterial
VSIGPTGSGPAFSRLLAPHRRSLIGVAGLSLIGGLAEAGVLVLVLDAAVLLSGAGTSSSVTIGPLRSFHPSIGALLVAAVVTTCVRIAVQLWACWITARLSAEIQSGLRISSFDAYIDSEWAIQAAEREGNLQQLLGVEVERATAAALLAASGLAAGCTLVMLLVSAVVLSPTAAAALVGLVTALFLGLRPISRASRRWTVARSGEERGVAESLGELVRVTEEIRVHGVREPEKRQLEANTLRVASWARRIQFVGLGLVQLYQGVALLLLVAALFAVHEIGTSSLSSLGAIVLILLRSFAYSQQLQNTYHQLVASGPSVKLIEAQQAEYRDRPARSGNRELGEIHSVALESVSYSYRPGRRALAGVSFAVDRREVVGVIGPSGAGKSTLVQILLRLRTPDAGRYLINGREAFDFDEDEWTRLVSYVPQEPKLVAGTVAENIRFLRPGYSDAQVVRAAQQANLHDEVQTWPSGYNTVIGQRTDAISGGQRQRLCIARALLSSPQLLVLDEPTSSLDIPSEQIIQETLASIQGQTTIFIIAHRLSTLGVCNRLLVLEDGRVEAFDTPRHLAQHAGFYRRVVDILKSSDATVQENAL